MLGGLVHLPLQFGHGSEVVIELGAKFSDLQGVRKHKDESVPSRRGARDSFRGSHRVRGSTNVGGGLRCSSEDSITGYRGSDNNRRSGVPFWYEEMKRTIGTHSLSWRNKHLQGMGVCVAALLPLVVVLCIGRASGGHTETPPGRVFFHQVPPQQAYTSRKAEETMQIARALQTH